MFWDKEHFLLCCSNLFYSAWNSAFTVLHVYFEKQFMCSQNAFYLLQYLQHTICSMSWNLYFVNLFPPFVSSSCFRLPAIFKIIVKWRCASLTLPLNVMKQLPQRAQCNVCHSSYSCHDIYKKTAKIMQLKEIQIKAEQSMLTIVWQLFCSPSTITAPMRFDTGMLTKKSWQL